jgi:thiol-disulfide isomerase/thioredoxin
VLVGCLLLAACLNGPAAPQGVGSTDMAATQSIGLTTYPAGQRTVLPDVSGQTLDGGTLDLASLRGHVVVLNVWASWCTECRRESPALAHLAAVPALSQVRFVGIDEQDSSSAAKSFATAVGTTYPHLVDRSGSLLAKLRMVPSTAIPSTIIVDQQGGVAARVIGGVDPASLLRVLKQLLAAQ